MKATMRRVAVSSLLGLAACGAAGAGGSTDWYYHWSCNGDSQCLALNPGNVGQASGTVGPEPGGQVGCNSLMTFGSGNWNIPPATQSCDNSPNAPPPALVSLTVSPGSATLAIGLSRQFTATAHYSDLTTRDVTAQATWGRSAPVGPPPAATVSAGGLVTAAALGSITITADWAGLHATAALTVGAATVQTITVTPADPTLAKGNSQQFTATGHYSDGTTANLTGQAAWTSATGSVATIASGGLAVGVAPGTSVITASYGLASGNTTLTVTGPALVSIAVTPPDPSVARLFEARFRAIGTYSDGTAQDITGQVTWTSAAGAVATIDSTGLAAALSPGTSLIAAASGPLSGQTTLTVTPATLSSVTVAPTDPTIAPGSSVPFYATGHFSDGTTELLPTGVTWSSGTTSVATVDPTGLATGMAVGTSTIGADVGGISGGSLLTVAATPPGASWAYLTTSPPVTCTACAAGAVALTSIVWSGTQFVAVGLSGAVVTSPDGLTWTTRVAGASYGVVSYGPLMSVTWAPALGRFVAVGAGNIMTSSDGSTWTPNTSGGIVNDVLYGVVWSGAQFVAVGYVYGTSTPVILTSPDGLAWTARTTAASGVLRGVAWSGTLFVAAGDVTLVSTDGVSWARVADATTGWTGVAWSGSGFVEVGVAVAGTTGKARTSPDGFTWTDRPLTSPPLYGVAWTGVEFVAVGGTGGQASYGLGGMLGSPGCLSSSADGITWTPRSISAVGTAYGTTYTIYGVAWSGTRLVAVGAGYFAYTSP